MKWAPFSAEFREEDAIVGEDADRHATEPGESGDESRRVARLELIEFRVVHQPADDLADIELAPPVGRDDAVELRGIEDGRGRIGKFDIGTLRRPEPRHNSPRPVERFGLGLGEMIGNTRQARVHVGTTEVLGRDHLPDCRLHQRRAAKEDRCAFDDHHLVGHRRYIGAAGRAGAEDDGNLGDAVGRKPGLIEEDAAEMVAVGKDLGLMRQVGTTGIYQIEAGQPVLAGDLLGAKMLFHRQGIVGAALDGRVVAHDHAVAAGDTADAGDQAGAMDRRVVHAVCRQRRQFKK